MRFSSRSHYGLQAMVALAQAYGEGPQPLGRVAKAQGIPLGYLEQLMGELRRAGLVESQRGAHGGYVLAAPPRDIPVGKVLRALEGPISPAECASEVFAPPACPRESDCPSQRLWASLRDAIAGVLDATTLEDLYHYRPLTEARDAAILSEVR
ncbi:MAG: RrF2 family transcriptional regulator [Chloroflexi bacterium]|nr:RrF2 family transcriptional regulator [Chloroflexota bacterium]